MSKKGICSICQQVRWIRSEKMICRPCGYSKGICKVCSTWRKIYINGLCYLCYQDKQVLKKLKEIEKQFVPACDYNKYLFELYLKYIKRYRLYYHHAKLTKKLKSILEDEIFQAILYWEQIYKLSKKYNLKQSSLKGNGCIFYKIGYMLQELGILPPMSEVFTAQINNSLHFFKHEAQQLIKPYLNMLEYSNRADSTKMDHLLSLKKFNNWIKDKNPKLNLPIVNEKTIRAYLVSLHENHNLKYIRKVHGHIKCFYRYCKYKRLILVDPAKNIKTSREYGKLCVCSENQIDKLFEYIKNLNSNPEYAMLISLVLIWGLKNEDLAHAKIAVKENTLLIILRQKKLTKGKRYHNREQVLHLPVKPAWFYGLQKSFYENWLLLYEKTKKSFPSYSLFLPYSLVSNRPLSKETITKRMLLATKAATGESISVRVLRQTCGFIHSRNQDASILSTLGWSQGFSFAYTWLPITYF